MWGSYSSRRSHEQPQNDNKQNSLSSANGNHGESHRRTSSEATPKQTTAQTRFLAAPSEQHDVGKNVFGSSPGDVSKRLGFLADKLSSSLSGVTGVASKSSNQSQQLHIPHAAHNRGDSSSTAISITQAAPPMSSSSGIVNAAKSHTSPSKASYGRTYDSKVVTREMHRLGNFAQGLAPQMSSAPSSSLSLPPPGSMSQATLVSTSTTDPWGALHVHVLPLFNGEPLRIPIEDLNVLVKRHIQTVVSSSPSRALYNLENDASELMLSGMVTLNAKLMGVEDEKLVARVVETWGFFWDQILTYLEGVLLPLQTDPLLLSLSKTKPHHRATSPSRGPGGVQSSKSYSQPLSTGMPVIEVRRIALRAFRDRVIYPLYPRLYLRLSLPNRQDVFQETVGYQQPRLQQMLLVLSAESRQRPSTPSLTAAPVPPTPGEAAILDLLQVMRQPQVKPKHHRPTHSRTPSFLSENVPRDRRGRIANKNDKNVDVDESLRDFSFGGIHSSFDPKGWVRPMSPPSAGYQSSREKERELLESLRSPTIPDRTSGGWGLGDVHEEMEVTEEEEEDEVIGIDQAQADLEKYMENMSTRSESTLNRR